MGWDSPVEEWMDEVDERVTDLVRRIALHALTGVAFRSPVQDGVFRANHNVGLQKPDHSYDLSKADGFSVIGRGEAKIKQSQIYPDIIISNALPYANALEHGHSQQAPKGVYAVQFVSTLEAFNHEFRDA